MELTELARRVLATYGAQAAYDEETHEGLAAVRGFIIVLAGLTMAVGLLFVISPLVRGLGLTRGAIVGLVLIAVGGIRLALEARRPPER